MTSPWSNQRVDLIILDASITGFSGLFIYSGPPARGNLIASAAALAGTDPRGNAYLANLATYDPINLAAGELAGAVLSFYTAASVAGPWNVQATVLWNVLTTALNVKVGVGSPQLVVEAAQVTANVAAQAAAGLAVTGGETADTVFVDSGQAGGLLLRVQNTTAAPTAPAVRLTGAAAGDKMLGIRVAGDTNDRAQWDTNGNLSLGPGSGGPDTSLYRAGAAQLAASYVAYDNGGAAETWNAPAFANSWANNAVGAPLQYRRVAAPYNSVQWVGSVTVPTGFAAGQAMITAVAAAYHPAHAQSILGFDVTAGTVVRLQYGTGGILNYESGASAAGDRIDIPPALISLDA